MEYQNLLLEKNEGLLVVTINRESKLNALNGKTLEELKSAFEMAYDEQDIRAVIITGKGEKAFVAGADISEFKDLNELNARKFSEEGQEIFNGIEACPKPVIAAVNGFALGGGCELSMACHIRVASDNAKFGLPEVSLGIIPGYGGTQRLPQLVGKGIANELIFTGDMISAQRAYEIGLVNHVVPQEELMDKAKSLANKILAKAPLAIAHAIDCVNASTKNEAGYQSEANAFASAIKTEDFTEGTTAFLEKRKPNFQGK
ncbi:enoyl-CoA hydratase/isomerase family protein [Flammeovirga yaeyamensis]|uniref:Enoyl-CoA hydratase/isomerase family protein n=1 Tax=Flammeovirga yaeyamensis TaxID=367791 RepID=A0AAX1N1X3_9BACT|nr:MULTISPECIES: enoyl-CoA hydratase-related protein [Flammeovirga]ANQ48555.1 enoyl-CoA hydratase [Flammeovirga sp. MY04]MBB3696449.1 enoyl-CoA hydratase [Flammeovirga yaeyamensis]NMF35128.1 enoyl-CoA hydratase [Flammeovirga yaeyamensis]QWG00052.1 enoyl-CoA hydratase/isomerase family protein [Flammeovirga yaeyamensis]